MTEGTDTRLFDAAQPSTARSSATQPPTKQPPNQPPAARKEFIRDLTDGQAVDGIFRVRERSLRKKRSGDDYLRLTLADASGTVLAVAWDRALELHAAAEPGTAVRARGRCEISERYGCQLILQGLSPAAEGEFDPADLEEAPQMDAGLMEADVRRLVETVRNPHLRRLLDELYGEESEVWRRFRAAPAAKFYHQAYKHGLLEHTLTVGQAVSAISASFPGIDRDLAVTGALIHDIGKIEAYSQDPSSIDLTDDGKLLGEIPLGYYLVRRTIEGLGEFPWELSRSLLHIVLSHHGALENGSPVVPATREATIVHMIDNLGGRLGSFDRLQKGLAEGESWSGYDRAISGSAYFPVPSGELSEPGAEETLQAASGE
jgi:3'-5' exoribonuclease